MWWLLPAWLLRQGGRVKRHKSEIHDIYVLLVLGQNGRQASAISLTAVTRARARRLTTERPRKKKQLTRTRRNLKQTGEVLGLVDKTIALAGSSAVLCSRRVV